MRTDKYTFMPHLAGGVCQYCGKYGRGVVIMLSRPFRKTMRCCYGCLIDWMVPIDPASVKQTLARMDDFAKHATEMADGQKKLEEAGLSTERKGNGDGLLSPVLAGSENEVPPPAKEDGRSRDESGRFVSVAG